MNLHGWIVDTSIKCDHEHFDGFLKVSLEEVLIALRGDRHLLNDPDSICSGRFLAPDFVPPKDPHQQSTLYPQGLSADAFVGVIERGVVWDELSLS